MTLIAILKLAYLITLLSCCAYAIRFGGETERQGVGIMAGGSVLTAVAVAFGSKWQSLQTGVFIVDLGVLAAFLTLALRSDKYWPLWTTAFQVIGVATHLARLADPAIVPRAYSIAQGFWAYPMLAAMVIGVRAAHTAATRRGVRY
jgi:cytochrome bd-type quinol oxidase subunit 2